MIAAREACHDSGLPHVTLDLPRSVSGERSSRRSSVVMPAGRRPNPCVRCNGGFRFAELLALRPPASAPRASRPVTTRASSSETGCSCSRARPTQQKDQSYMLARLDPRLLDPCVVPARRPERRTRHAPRRRGPGWPRANRPESQEACFLAGDDYRSFLERSGLEARPGPIVDEEGAVIGSHDRPLVVHARAAARPWRRGGGAALRARHRSPARTPSSPGHGGRSPGRASRLAAGSTSRPSGLPPSCAIARRRSLRSVQETARGFRLALDEPAYGVAPGQAAVLYDGDVVVGSGLVTSSATV